jgi:hypothetical protein
MKLLMWTSLFTLITLACGMQSNLPAAVETEMIMFVAVVISAFVIGCVVGYFFCQMAYASAANSGKVFMKHKNRWYPYNPFTGKEPK